MLRLCKFLNVIDGGALISEESHVVALDKDNKSLTYSVCGGDLKKQYKEMYITVQATTKGETNFLTWIYEYEKVNEEVSGPQDKLEKFATRLTNTIDAHFLKEMN